MTQAFNLSQLANFVNTSGQLNAATGLFNQVPVANGGTGVSTVTTGALLLGAGTSAMTELVGTTPGTTVVSSPTGWTSAPAASVAGGNYNMLVYTSPAAWSKPASLKALRVTVIGAGGNGGGVPSTPAATSGFMGGGGAGGAAIDYIPAPAIPGPVTITAGAGTNSFGAFCSATNGANAASGVGPATPTTAGGAGGTGSGGQINLNGQPGFTGGTLISPTVSGAGGAGAFGFGYAGAGSNPTSPNNVYPGKPALNYGAGGGGAAKNASTGAAPAGAGVPGIVIVEEFY